MIFLLIIFISCIKGQTTQPSNYSCNQNNGTVQFTLSSTYHSAWHPSLNCSLQQCNITSNNNDSCLLSSTPCFEYRTLNNARYCAPAIECSILLPCANNTYSCTSNSSICVINSCCSSQPVCLPLIFTNFCPSVESVIITMTTMRSTSSITTTSSLNPYSNGIYWNATGSIVAGTGSYGIGLNQLNNPYGIYLDPSDNLYVNDDGNARVMKYLYGTSNGTIVAGTSGVRGTGLNQFSYISYLSMDSSGNLYIADTNNNRVMRWTNGTATGSIVAGNGTLGSSLNLLSAPCGVWVDSSLNLFITDYSNHRVVKWSSGASAGVVVAGVTGLSGYTSNTLYNPTGLYFDEINQDLYITNTVAHTIMRWHIGDLNGTIISGVPGVSGSNATLLNYPYGITLDQWKNLYVSDASNNRIQLFCNGSRTGITIAGTGTGGRNLSHPFDIKFDSQMNLYVSEYNGARVVKFGKL